ncbi:hypothetical protein F67_I3_11_066 [Rhizobium phage RHph_I3_11]|nr:hypothetical protein F67_I3_11_066 [Rhizobium phage RHph_I3_11]
MFKVKYVSSVHMEDDYINADNFSAYDQLVHFYTNHIEDRIYPTNNPNLIGEVNVSYDYTEKAVRSEVVAAINKHFIFSITKVDGLPFTQGQTGDTGEDI